MQNLLLSAYPFDLFLRNALNSVWKKMKRSLVVFMSADSLLSIDLFSVVNVTAYSEKGPSDRLNSNGSLVLKELMNTKPYSRKTYHINPC